MKFIIQVLTEENKQVGKVELKSQTKRDARVEMAKWIHGKLMSDEIGTSCEWYDEAEYDWGIIVLSEPINYTVDGWYDLRSGNLVLSDLALREGCDNALIDYRKYVLVEIATPE